MAEDDHQPGEVSVESYRPAPDVWDGMPVSRDDFSTLSRPPGWKYETGDGRLRLEPDWQYHVARWTGAPGPAAPPRSGVSVGRATAADVDGLTDAADAAFTDGPDFFRWPAAKRRASLRQSIEDALTLEPAWVAAAHRVARDCDGAAVGLLLVREVAGGVTLETVGVRPGWRRGGLAAEMFRSAVMALPEGTEVRSAWLVANRESEAWHRGVGFEVVPTSVSERSRTRAEMWARRVPVLSDEGQAVEAEIRRLEEAEREGRAPDPSVFARPVHRRPPA